jgi:hypothetical protein
MTILRAQDLLASIKLAIVADDLEILADGKYADLAAELALSPSEAHAAVRRSKFAGLLNHDRRVNRAALLEFLIHGVKYAFPAKPGKLTRGMPTAHGAPPLAALIDSGGELPPVWPDPEGEARGESFEPLYRSVPKAARRDSRLYEILCLVDAIRGGRARERALAEQLLRERLAT